MFTLIYYTLVYLKCKLAKFDSYINMFSKTIIKFLNKILYVKFVSIINKNMLRQFQTAPCFDEKFHLSLFLPAKMHSLGHLYPTKLKGVMIIRDILTYNEIMVATNDSGACRSTLMLWNFFGILLMYKVGFGKRRPL